MNFKPNKHELYLFNREREIEKRENRVREREERGRKDKREKIENFEFFF